MPQMVMVLSKNVILHNFIVSNVYSKCTKIIKCIKLARIFVTKF